tara:strand:- start:164 stop:766 length:603 start_codon:yes stop_codon:yes gene_type:complete
MALTFNGSSNTIGGLAAGGLPDACIQEADLAAGVNTIKEVDMWQLTDNFSYTASPVTDLTANWVRSSTTATGDYQTFGAIGSAMTQSSGIFTFPSTGVWRIDFNVGILDSNSIAWAAGLMRATKDNSTYVKTSESWSSIINAGGANVYESNHSTTLFDVTNTSTHKLKFSVQAASNMTVYGDNSDSGPYTYALFTRLGDT